MVDPITSKLIELAYLEDSANGDITSELTISSHHRAKATFVAKEALVLAGIPYVDAVISYISKDYELRTHRNEGEHLQRGDIVAELEGYTRDLLRAERIVLNLMQRLSGIATLTREYVQRVSDLPVKVVDTRKTTPGMRAMEKYAVRIGGADNHRFGLSDGILIKDNHIRAAGSITKAIKLARKAHHLLRIEVEVSTVDEVREAIDSGAEVIMLDNMEIQEMQRSVTLIDKRAIVEASGGVSLDNIRSIAQTGVDLISVGAITHSARAVDISMKIL